MLADLLNQEAITVNSLHHQVVDSLGKNLEVCAVSEDGYVVTNYHVVDGATKIEVTTHGGETYPAELIGYDNTNDVAVLKIAAQGLRPV